MSNNVKLEITKSELLIILVALADHTKKHGYHKLDRLLSRKLIKKIEKQIDEIEKRGEW